MSKFELKLPRMGESVAEATLTSWLKEVGDTIEMDEAIFEIATDKVDSEVPSEVDGVLIEKCFNVDDVIKVGQTVAIIEIDGDVSVVANTTDEKEVEEPVQEEMVSAAEEAVIKAKSDTSSADLVIGDSDRFYSPLVKNIAKQEGISFEALETISGTGKDGRVTKDDILNYVKNGASSNHVKAASAEQVKPAAIAADRTSEPAPVKSNEPVVDKPRVPVSGGDEVISMTRMGKLIAKHMTDSVSTSAHVQSFIEVDVTNIVNWRNKMKDAFFKREGEKLTFTPIFMEAVAKALKKYPMMNISVDGDTVIKKKNINIGMAAALPDGNLIVPVIKNADQLNLVGMAKVINDLANRSRNNALKPDEVQGGTYTVTNVGTFGSVFGTPIINQPQVGILALGAIRKMPSVIETPEGDFIGIRSKMYLSHSYDHRVVNGALGSMFAKTIADYLEAWNPNREI
ncbi:dihydrolipoamide acetyltransferase family protein [Maribacter arcticus]|uniref:Dihydrolipoamide acetyltransferase component of pyruvate dehydrogenase complex n=1 Tax=Maribacter arcticus TaxID=561365 RepID=A0A1T5CA80_9FLAO|nr:dihydrolipoamide acetyltransferase family protein [Maribacter arcticus]SKB56358.1 2-oxoglutarate dehydrogenase E2 component (dihydrolipoamide succinyltransferase) [Maribacter arcticus]|tara:strand:+ start:5610 stop:6977 length:1368 start_codon:yes stop_codon:yes gene_type:complete